MLNPWLLAGLAAASVLYSSVGHAGASGYLAVMALAGVDSAVMKPAALVLNLAVAAIAAARFARAGPLFVAAAVAVRRDIRSPGVRRRCDPITWPVVQAGRRPRPPLRRVTALPRDTTAERHRASWQPPACQGHDERRSHWPAGRPDRHRGRHLLEPAVAVHPLVGNTRKRRRIRGVHPAELRVRPRRQCREHRGASHDVWLWTGIVIVGGLIGSELGSRRVAVTTFRRLLAAVLVVAGLKLLLLL